mmetsp:Transcript_95422/g.270109  ORF Transcript_95422/g.270109 Transcript_95422/m.270109 type:complete len:174 (-) Transcript_95422:98-619(-)
MSRSSSAGLLLLTFVGAAGGVALGLPQPACAMDDQGLTCYQSPSMAYMTDTLAQMQGSAFGGLFSRSEPLQGTCADHGYGVLLGPEDCFQEWTISTKPCVNISELDAAGSITNFTRDHNVTVEEALAHMPCDLEPEEAAARSEHVQEEAAKNLDGCPAAASLVAAAPGAAQQR